MSIKKVLGSISPLAGAITGEGMFGGLRKISPVMMAIDALKDKKKAGAKGVEVEGEEVAVEGMKRGGAVKKMAYGGPVKKPVPTPAERAASKAQDERLKNAKVTKEEVRTLNSANRSEGGMPKMAKGGSASSRADGCATKGKTKGRMV
jgi:hypothetical protein